MSKLLLYRPIASVFRFAIISLIVCNLVVSGSFLNWTPPAQSQLPSLSIGAADNPLNPPDGVTRNGEYETVPIKSPLDDKFLFDVTSPTIFDRDEVPEGKLPAEIRAQEVNERLWRIFNRTLRSKQVPTVTIATLNNRPVLEVRDDQTTRPVRLVTVTEPDADFNGRTREELAREWQKIVQAEMERFKQFAAPEVIAERLRQALQILLGLLVASVVIWFLRRLLARRQQALEAQYQQQLATLAEVAEAQDSKVVTQIEANKKGTATREVIDLRSQFLSVPQQLSVKRRLELDRFLKWGLFWIFILMWYIGVARIISTVPFLMRWSLQVWATPLLLLIIWFGISLAIRVSKSLIDQVTHSWKVNSLSLGEAQRTALRSTTIAEALKGLVTFVLVIVGIIWSLGLFNVATSSIVAGGAVIGLAISFGSQSLIKDLVNGCLILIEDQFAVGDVIQIGDKGGLVEALNLRVTQLRNGEGQLITIPNSNISNVCNLTRLWSRIDFSIVVAYENDPKQVLDVLQQVSHQLYSEPKWRDCLPEPPQVLGIDDLSHTGMLVRVWIKTAPMEQWSVGREFRLRVRQAFEANQIQIGRPQLITYNAELNGSTLHNSVSNQDV
jgi:small conductance mechanosensitive channel